MSGYARVNTADDDDHVQGAYAPATQIPTSPPPSFRSRPSSPVLRADPLRSDADRELHDTFDSPSDGEGSDDEHEGDDRQRLVRRATNDDAGQEVQTRITPIPVTYAGRLVGGGNANDGVFANLNAKPTRGEDLDEKPPTYEQAAADATPGYYETVALIPGGTFSDEVYVEGLPVGSVFSFVWNAMISMSFQVVGFLLTYLLHTTHAAKNGSLAGLGITLVQFGFSMKSASLRPPTDSQPAAGAAADFSGVPQDPNNHDFEGPKDGGGQQGQVEQGISSTDWFAYVLMIVGWFILIRSISDFLRARRHEQLVLQSPERGLPVPVVAEGETPAQAV